jgi:phage FluMu protein Com
MTGRSNKTGTGTNLTRYLNPKCPKCGKTFTTNKGLSLHFVTHPTHIIGKHRQGYGDTKVFGGR